MKRILSVSAILIILIVINSSFSNAICLFGKGGIEGYVFLETGNMMPSPDRPRAKPAPYKTTVCIYELTNMSQVVRDNDEPSYREIKTRLVKKVETNDKGYFKVNLPSGKYSLFAYNDTLYYANEFDGENNIFPVEVKGRKKTKITMKVSKGAVY